MAKTLLQIVQDASKEMALPAPTIAAGSADEQVKQLVALANREGRELAARRGPYGGWPVLRKEHSITLVNAQQDYALPSDLSHYINRTGWDNTRKWELSGPMTPQEWRFLESGYPATGFLFRYRVMANKVFVHPVPSSPTSTLVIEYYSKNWAQSSGGTPQDSFVLDTDVPAISDELIILGLKWRFLRAKGLSYDEEKDTYERAVDREIAAAGTSRDLFLARGAFGSTRIIDYANVPDGGFG